MCSIDFEIKTYNIWNLQRYLLAHLWASHTPSVVDFKVVPMLCTVIGIACYFLALP